jgi:hypothetical protein
MRIIFEFPKFYFKILSSKSNVLVIQFTQTSGFVKDGKGNGRVYLENLSAVCLQHLVTKVGVWRHLPWLTIVKKDSNVLIFYQLYLYDSEI